ncbi:MAG: EF-hand domain-containing protein [Pseudomonadales bacterium]|nr:EF-hand domain-containing protein [Pseudomonadales bacterium]
MKIRSLKTISLLLILGHSAVAENHNNRTILHHLDNDDDGLISFQEFHTSRHDQRFQQADQNEDGLLTLEEMMQHRTKKIQQRTQQRQVQQEKITARLAAHFTAMDSNEDGVLTAEERKIGLFNKLDSNQDGYLASDELDRPRTHGRHGMKQHHGRKHDQTSDLMQDSDHTESID